MSLAITFWPRSSKAGMINFSKIKQFFKKNRKNLSWFILIFIGGLLVGWLWQQSGWWPAGLLEQPSPSPQGVSCPGGEPGPLTPSKTIIDGIILKIDLTQKVFEVKARTLTSLNDLTKTKSVDETKIIKINEATQFIRIIKKDKEQKNLSLTPEELKTNDSVSIIVAVDLISLPNQAEIVAEFVRLIEIQE